MFIFSLWKNIFVCKKKWTKNSITSISRFNYQSTELQIGKPLSLNAAIVMSVNKLSALILSLSFYALLLWTKIKPCFWNEILFIRDIKSFNGDGIFIFMLYFSKNLAYWCLSSFFFLLFWSPDLLVFTSRVIWKEVLYYFSYRLCSGLSVHISVYVAWRIIWYNLYFLKKCADVILCQL